MAGMGYVSKAFDRLPTWVQWVLAAVAFAGIIYGVAHYGWTFLLKVIFSP